MAQKIYIVEGRKFQTAAEYNRAVRDREIIERLRQRMDDLSAEQLKQLKKEKNRKRKQAGFPKRNREKENHYEQEK